MAKRAEAEEDGTAITIGRSEARKARGDAIEQAKNAMNSAAPTINQEEPQQSSDSTSSLGSVEEERKSDGKVREADDKAHEQLIEQRNENLKKLAELQEAQLATTGTTAPAA
jgi:hypothetical protein